MSDLSVKMSDLIVKASVFEVLNAVNVNGHTEKKNGLTYLAWAWAWGEVKKRYPDAFYTIYENANGFFYHTDGKTCWVKTGVTIGGQELIEYLPVMDFKNKSIPLESVTSFDVNKAIQRSLTKAIARHGLGLYIYAGEDLPEEDAEAKKAAEQAEKIAAQRIDNTKSFALLKRCEEAGVDVKKVCALYKIKTLADMTERMHENVLANWDKVVEKCKAEES